MTPFRATRLKYVAELHGGGTPPVDDHACWAEPDSDLGYPWAAIADLTREPLVRFTARRVSDLGVARARLTVGEAGTLLFAIYASLGTMGRLAVPACWNQAILGITARSGQDSRYIEYSLRALRPQIGRWARSSTQHNLNAEQVGNLPLFAASETQQKRVVAFLDRECERIAQVETLLGSIARMSHESWIARARDVIGFNRHPSAQIRFLARTGTGHTPARSRPDWWLPQECVIPWFTLADVHQIRHDAVDIVADTTERITSLGLSNSSAVLHPAGTVLLSRTASVGFSAIAGVAMAVSQDFMTWTCGPKLEPWYLFYALRSNRPEIRRLMYGSTHKTIYMPDLLALRVPLPSLEEQRLAIEAVSKLSTARRMAVDSTALMRDRLTEYRDALITEAVTGQSDVTTVSDQQMDERMHEAIEAPRA